MAEKVTYKCNLHPDPWECPDHVVIKIKNDKYGLPIRDGEGGKGSSYLNINYCPWCGEKLGKEKIRVT